LGPFSAKSLHERDNDGEDARADVAGFRKTIDWSVPSERSAKKMGEVPAIVVRLEFEHL
jgi:hypothetical protein